MTQSPSALHWLDDETLVCAGTTILAVFDDRSQELQSTPERFILMKSRDMVDWYERTFAGEDRPRRVLEIGIFKGGSVALFSEMWDPERLVAVDIAAEPVAALTEYVARCDLRDSVKPLYGIDQADREMMRSIIAEEFGGAALDLVVDDGCHFYQETKAAFEAVLPFVRPGGTYVIEDWGWAHWPGVWQEDGGPWPDKPAMSMLVLELAMLCASRSDLIESMEITPGLIVVRRGEAEAVDPSFTLSGTCLTAGRLFVEEGFAPSDRELAHAVEVARLNDRIRALEASHSWRATAPLRWIGRALRG
ncbi:MAG: class I SAM-dependent methyltransferase [Actinobacteria bacterium]|nr:class I SAM-dependent methyltransferase [Actinomycetota bacterium]